MRSTDNELKLLWITLMMMWASAAWAAEASFVNDLTSLSLAEVAISAVLSFVGGAASTAAKFANPTIAVKNVWLEILKDILLSVLAGVLTFFLTTWWGWPSLVKAFTITVAGYGGSRVLESYLTGVIDKLTGLFSAAKPGV